MRESFIGGSYLVASVLFILGLRSLTRPDKARRGMQQAAVGMLFAIAGTLLNHTIVDYRWIVAGLVLGVIIGYPMGQWVPMTAMPQRIALSLTLSALAATLVGIAEYYTDIGPARRRRTRRWSRSASRSCSARSPSAAPSSPRASCRSGSRPSRSRTRGRTSSTALLFLGILTLLVISIVDPTAQWAFYSMIGASLLFGVLLVMPIGGADMPVVVALLNSYSGLASCATGFAIGNVILIISGSLDGSSGFILSILMSKAMNRSFTNVLFGAFGSETAAISAKSSAGLAVRSISVEDAAIQLAYAQLVIVIPGYGMAVAQAQHAVRELAEMIEKRGGEVKFAVHPVAGRMPGHMNVLLAEANVPYDKLYDMDEINSDFERADVALVIGANDVVNPAARNDKASPDLRHADLERRPRQERDRAQARHERGVRRHRERAVLRSEDEHAVRRREGVVDGIDRGDQERVAWSVGR